jgi:N-acetylmuramoyl-L-alanine amidase
MKRQDAAVSLLLFLMAVFVSHRIMAESTFIRGVNSSNKKEFQIPIRNINATSYFSLLELTDQLRMEITRDYVPGIVEARFRDHTIKFKENSRFLVVDDDVKSLSENMVADESGLWLPVDAIPAVIEPLSEGEITWDAGELLLRILSNEDSRTDIPVVSQGRLTIAIDAGHGGDDRGCQIPTGISEKEINLRICERLAKILKDRLGAIVVMTRQGDYVVEDRVRAATANTAKADLFVSVHISPPEDMKSNGFLLFTVPPVESASASGSLQQWNETSSALADQSKQISLQMGASLSKASSGTLWESRQLNVGVLQGLIMPGVVIELAWTTAFFGDQPVDNEAGANRAAESIYDAVSAALDLKK